MAGFNMQVYMNPEPFLILFSSYSRECEPDLSKALAKRTTSRHKFNAWVYLRFRLARTCVHLRWLTDDDLCSLWSRSNLHASPRRFFTVWPPNQVELSPFVISFAWWLHFGQAGLPGLKRPYSLVINKNRGRVGLSRSCSATFEQLFGFGATFSPSSNFSDFEHFFPFWITFSPF